MSVCVTEEYYSHHYRSICFLSEATDDFGKGDREKRECLCINRAEETEGARESHSHKPILLTGV